MVGVPSDAEQPHKGSATPKPNKRDGSEPMNNATLAYIHNNGSPAANIPARPFLEPGIKNAKQEIARRLGDAGRAALAGKKGAVEANLDAAGIVAVNSIRREIQSGLAPPLAQLTVDARRQRSKGSKYRRKATTAADTKPLIDTTQLLNSISYVKRQAKK